MKRILPRLLIVFLMPSCFTSYSQDLTGIWRGYFVTEDYQEYKFELQIEQKGNIISGVSYSYLNTIFYGKATLAGNFNKAGQSALVQEIKTIELEMASGSSACIMKCSFAYVRSGREEFLEGTFTSKHEKSSLMFKKGDDCGSGKVTLRKVTTSDFYVEPFLRERIKKDSLEKEKVTRQKNDNPEIKKPQVTKINPPVTKPPVTVKTNTTTQKTVVKKNPTPDNKNTGISTINTPVKKVDSVRKIDVAVINNQTETRILNNPDVLTNRENELVKTITVTDPNVLVKLYDNGEIDGDSISVYLDKKLLLSHQMLTASPIVIKLKMDEDNAEHELIMVAENLGRIPPNTSLMIVESGDKSYNVFITSTERKNAVVRFRYQKIK